MRSALPALVLGAALALAVTGRASAQTSSVDLRSLVGSARLGAGYAQMISIAAVPGISSASYAIDSEAGSTIDVVRVPYQHRWMRVGENVDLYWKVSAGYLRFENDFLLDVFRPSDGTIASRWTGYSAGGGLLAKIRLGHGFTLEPSVDVALARLDNSTSYSDAAALLQPLLDRLLFNWDMNAWLLTPSVSVEWADTIDEGKMSLRAYVARSWIDSFDETDPVLAFNEAVNVYSLVADYTRPTNLRLFDRPMSWVAQAGYYGFFGADRDALGFDSVAEIGGGFEMTIATDTPDVKRLRLVGAYLVGPDVHGWSVGLTLRF